MSDMTVSISGLNNLDRLEIGTQSGVRFEPVEVPRGAHGEMTLLTAYFAMTALTALAAYLLRKHDGQSFEEIVVITHPDGRREERRIKWNRTSTAPPDAEIIRQIRSPLPDPPL
jgi:hypothetical protein